MVFEKSRDLLLDEQGNEEEVQELLSAAGFTDWRGAQRCLQRMAASPQARQALSEFLPHLLLALSGAAGPNRVLVNLERFSLSFDNPADILQYLAANPRAVEILMRLFAGSQFLTEILLRNPEYFERLVEHKRLAQPKSVEQFYAEAQAAIAQISAYPEQLDALRRFQRLELLRIGACDLLELLDLPAVTMQLSNLAQSLVQICLALTVEHFHAPAEGFTVLAMGKLGGQELNYSSDIDLLFVSTTERGAYRRLGEQVIGALTKVTAEGFLYRVDMRLRPWGKSGALVSSLEAYFTYLKQHAQSWEKQALLKARPIAGDLRVGDEFLRQAQPLLFDQPAETIRSDVYAMKQRTEAYLRQQGREWGEVKLGEGSIRDVEFVIQYLQLIHGARLPEILIPNTLDALARLYTRRLLTANEYRVLADGYIFLRTIEHYLQMMHYQQTYTLPADPEAIAQLARRLGFRGPEAGEDFIARYEQHCAAIRTIYLQHVGNDGGPVIPAAPTTDGGPEVPDHLSRMDPSYVIAFSDEDIQFHASLAEQLNDENLVEVVASPLDDELWRISIVAYDYPGELSLICGLLLVYNLNILDGNVFTYEPLAEVPHEKPKRQIRQAKDGPPPKDVRRKIVDVFTVRPLSDDLPAETWSGYRHELAALLQLMHQGRRREARGELAKRVAMNLPEPSEASAALYPIDIEIDNVASQQETVLRIYAPDTPGFLYEFTNALAFYRIYINRVSIDSIGNQINDTLYVTDADGSKITDPDRQRELRAAIVLIKHFTHLLPYSPNPETALLHFREFVYQLFVRPGWPDELASLERPEVLNALAQLLGISDFLWEDFLRMQYANLFPVVRDVDMLAETVSREQLQAELQAILDSSAGQPDTQAGRAAAWRSALNAFKDRQLFRIDMRHILNYTLEFEQFSQELTDLAELVVTAAYQRCYAELLAQYGLPCLENGEACPLSVCALGKCGGHELGFASDIELIFIYAGNGRTRGPKTITTAEFYEKLVEEFMSAIQARREGIFQVDLQLRPYGKAGSLAVAMDAFRRYYAPEGPAWAYERQALVRLRPIAGDEDLGRQIVHLRDQYVYGGEPFDTSAMRAMRERQVRHLVKAGTFNAKYSPGGLLDVEYLVQGLQINHGQQYPELRLTNTRATMAALAAHGILSGDEFTRLHKAHTFLRWLIDSLRVVRGNAKDMTVPPADSEEFSFLARRLRYGKDLARLRDELTRYTADVQALNKQLLR